MPLASFSVYASKEENFAFLAMTHLLANEKQSIALNTLHLLGRVLQSFDIYVATHYMCRALISIYIHVIGDSTALYVVANRHILAIHNYISPNKNQS